MFVVNCVKNVNFAIYKLIFRIFTLKHYYNTSKSKIHRLWNPTITSKSTIINRLSINFSIIANTTNPTETFAYTLGNMFIPKK